jgi:hypothetical protein
MAQLSRVLFVGGDRRLGSVQVRCVQIADALGCDYVCLDSPEALPAESQLARYDVVVLVKPPVPAEAFDGRLVVWDVIDWAPPRADVTLASTKASLRALGCGQGTVIPHHHLNDGPPNPLEPTVPGWVGWSGWYPELTGLEHRTFFVDDADSPALRDVYRQIGIGLNLRRRSEEYEQHVAINSGIKLINCMAFGIASVSEREPAYVELGEGCTLFTTAETWTDDVARLQRDQRLRKKLRKRGLKRASDFRLERVAKLYRRFLEKL